MLNNNDSRVLVIMVPHSTAKATDDDVTLTQSLQGKESVLAVILSECCAALFRLYLWKLLPRNSI